MGARRRVVGWLAVLVALIGPAAMAQRVPMGGQEGLPAPNFTVSPVNGSSLSLRKLVAGAGGVVAFVDHRSRDGLRLIGYLEAQHKSWKEQKVGLVIVVISAMVRDTVAKFVDENDLTVPMANDPGNQLSRQFGLYGPAMAMVIDHEGLVTKRAEETGSGNDIGPQIGLAVQELLKPDEPAEGDATGGATKPGEGDPKAGAADPAAPVAPGAPTGTAPAQPVKPTMSDAEARERIAKGLQLLQRGYSQAVLEEARLIVARRPTDPLALLWLAYALEATRQYPEAAVTYRELVRLVPGHAYAAAALQRVDPTGRWRTAADLPGAQPGGQPAPAKDAAPAPAPAPAKGDGQAPSTSGQGASAIE